MSAAPDLTDSNAKLQVVGTQRELRRSSETRVVFWHTLVASSFFILVLGASLFLGTVMMVGTFRTDGSSPLTAAGRTGRISRVLNDGTLCHYLIFDNKSAQTLEDRIGRCDEGKPKPKLERPAAGFSWGGK